MRRPFTKLHSGVPDSAATWSLTDCDSATAGPRESLLERSSPSKDLFPADETNRQSHALLAQTQVPAMLRAPFVGY